MRSRASIHRTLLIFGIFAALLVLSTPASAAPQEHARSIQVERDKHALDIDIETITGATKTVQDIAVAVEDLISGASPSAGTFVRMNHAEDGEPVAMETAIARYVPAIGGGDLIVDLIGVVHFGDQMYYQTLNNRFSQYDALLYELVGPEGAIPGGGGPDPLNKIMRKMAVLFCDLESQLALIDYKRDNFVHADLSPQGIAEAMAERGENKWTMLLGVTADLIRSYNLRKREMLTYNGTAPAQESINWKEDWKKYFLAPDGFCRVRRLLAGQLADATSMSGLGRTIEQILIDDRNKAVMDVFRRELVNGKRHIGIFYGAGHMQDLEKRLMSEYGLKRESVEWLPAWDLRMRQRTPVEVVFKMMRP